jgi:hypothetical protein
MSQQINLFNPIFLKQEKHFSAQTMLQSLAVILLCGILLTVYSAYERSSLESNAKRVAAQWQATQNQLAKVSAEYGPKKKDEALQARVQRAAEQVGAMQRVVAILRKGDFGNTDGYAGYMSAFARQIIDGVWLTGFTIEGAGSDISIQGSALRPALVPTYLNRLKSEPVMHGASFSTLEMSLPKKKADTAAKPDPETVAGGEYINFNLRSSAEDEAKKMNEAAGRNRK